MKNIRTTNMLLLIIVIPIIFYLLKILSFIFIPLVFSMFIALLFLPLMRWLKKKKVPKPISIFIVIVIIGGVLKIGGELIQLSSKEILSADGLFLEKAEIKLVNLITLLGEFFGLEYVKGENILGQYIFQKDIIARNFGSTLDFIGNILSMTLMTAFLVILWLAESINFQKILNNTILKQKYSSVKAFMKIENDIIKFIKVKFIISLLTGLFISLACLLFDVSFPIFWGLFAFAINFLQMIGSFITVILLALFAFVELDPTSVLFFFILTITAVEVLFGSILEPIFMGKSFSINIITILVMLMFWGYMWGVAGLIMSVPITVFIKIILEQYSRTKIIASLMAGTDKKVLIPLKVNK
ncbi:MAG: AI-2E family transporter [Bacteroidales bacterium]|nr:AI-2E family transporter [Bacteroidales bacterium]